MFKNLLKKIKYFFILWLLSPIMALAYNFSDGSGLKTTATTAGYDAGDLNKNPEDIIVQGIGLVLTFVGIIFLVLMIYGGFRWMTARGNETEVDKAKKVIIQSVIGIIIVFAAYVISYFVINYFGKATLS